MRCQKIEPEGQCCYARKIPYKGQLCPPAHARSLSSVVLMCCSRRQAQINASKSRRRQGMYCDAVNSEIMSCSLQGQKGLIGAVVHAGLSITRLMLWSASVTARLLPFSLGCELAPGAEVIIGRLLSRRFTFSWQWTHEQVRRLPAYPIGALRTLLHLCLVGLPLALACSVPQQIKIPLSVQTQRLLL